VKQIPRILGEALLVIAASKLGLAQSGRFR
jgi:hypothetical protein